MLLYSESDVFRLPKYSLDHIHIIFYKQGRSNTKLAFGFCYDDDDDD